jgi:hypothetical protein
MSGSRHGKPERSKELAQAEKKVKATVTKSLPP